MCVIIKCKGWFLVVFAGQLLCHDYCASAPWAQYEQLAQPKSWHLRAPQTGDRAPGGAARRAKELPPRVPSLGRAVTQPGLPGGNLEMYSVLLLFRDETDFKTKPG